MVVVVALNTEIVQMAKGQSSGQNNTCPLIDNIEHFYLIFKHAWKQNWWCKLLE